MIILLIFLVLAGAFSTACCIAGFGSPGTLDSFRGDGPATERRFAQPADQVMAAYRAGVDRTPGMRSAGERGRYLLVDLRPTSRILGGNFGMAIRLEFREHGTGTVVSAEARNKVPWSLTNHGAAFTHAERVMRMNAKQSAIEELVR